MDKKKDDNEKIGPQKEGIDMTLLAPIRKIGLTPEKKKV